MNPIKIGTRGSKLALIQAQKVLHAIQSAHPDRTVELVVIETSGDWKPSHGETLLSEASGGKGLFTKELEMALVDGRVDVGVHSLKDVPTFLPEELTINHVLERDDPRDAFISLKADNLNDLPQEAVLGTSSMRRAAIALSKRPDLKIVPLRGNVDTRLQKIADGQVDATFLAAAGLKRMGLEDKITSCLSVDEMLPAVSQGIIAMQIRTGDDEMAKILDAISHEPTHLVAVAERAVLEILDGSCRTPIGSYASLDGDMMSLSGLVAEGDGSNIYSAQDNGVVKNAEDAHALGVRVGQAILAKMPAGYKIAHG